MKIKDKNLGLIGTFVASILGILSPLCMYGTIPIAASFSKNGMEDDWLAAFMMSSILLNPQLLIYSAALGNTALLIRLNMSMGAGTAFMITGPATKITNLGALKIVLGIKNFIIYLVYVMLFALLSGLLIDLVGITI